MIESYIHSPIYRVTMKLKTASVTGLFNMFDHEVRLRPEGLTFIHSPNGYGKSTFVRMIYLALKGNRDALMDIPFTRMDMSFTDDVNLIIERTGDELLVQMQKNELETEADEDELRSLMDVQYITPERLAVRKMDGRLVPALEAYATEFTERLRAAKENDGQGSKKKRKDLGDDELEFWSKDLKAKLDFMKDAGFEYDMPSGMRFPPNRHDLNGYRDDYADLIFDIADFVDRNYYLAESIVVYKDILNGLLVKKNAYVNDTDMIGIELDDGTSLPLNRLSSGEKQIMIIFYRLLFHASPGSLVILDEPEISLHISWQQRIGSILLDVARLRDLQILVATHSPQIVHDMWNLADELRAESA